MLNRQQYALDLGRQKPTTITSLGLGNWESNKMSATRKRTLPHCEGQSHRNFDLKKAMS